MQDPKVNYQALLLDAAELLADFRESGAPADVAAANYFKHNRRLGSRERRFLGDTFFHLLRHLRRIDEALLSGLTGMSIVGRCPAIGFPVTDPICARAWQVDRMPSGWPSSRPKRREAQRWVDVARLALASADRDCDTQAAVLEPLIDAWSKLPPPEGFPEPNLTSYERMLTRACELAQTFASDTSARHADRALSFPGWIWAQLGHGLPPAEGIELAAALNQQGPPTVRVNTLVCDIEQAQAELSKGEIATVRGRWADSALILEGRVARPSLPMYREGWFEFQDEASQLCSYFAAPRPGDLVVDACAGGGGKSLHLAAIMHNEGRILAYDSSLKRLSGLEGRTDRSATKIIEIGGADPAPEAIAEIGADVVLIDSPCSGMGTVRRSPELPWRLTPDRLRELLRIQAMLLDRWSHAVGPYGVLVYSTCSILHDENAAQIEGFLERNPGWERDVEGARAALGKNASQLLDRKGDMVLYPHRHGCDGFYSARLRRKSE